MAKAGYLRIYTDGDRQSRFADEKMELNPINFAPPAPPLNLSAFIPTSRWRSSFALLAGSAIGIQHLISSSTSRWPERLRCRQAMARNRLAYLENAVNLALERAQRQTTDTTEEREAGLQQAHLRDLRGLLETNVDAAQRILGLAVEKIVLIPQSRDGGRVCPDLPDGPAP